MRTDQVVAQRALGRLEKRIAPLAKAWMTEESIILQAEVYVKKYKRRAES
jgi:hypothetical protein